MQMHRGCILGLSLPVIVTIAIVIVIILIIIVVRVVRLAFPWPPTNIVHTAKHGER